MILAARQNAGEKAWAMSTSLLARELLSKRASSFAAGEIVIQTDAYMQDLYRRALLAPDEEKLLFEWLAELKQTAVEIAELPDDLRCEQTCRHFSEIERDIVLVRNHLVESNLRLVIAAARKFRSSAAVEFHDLICEGNAILMKAVDLFKVELGYRFSTYAMTALHRGFFNYVQREHKLGNRFRSGEVDYFDSVEDESTPGELALEAVHDVPRLLEGLDERERDIIVSRFGLVAGEKKKTFREIGSKYNLSKERIRQITNKALLNMREKIEGK